MFDCSATRGVKHWATLIKLLVFIVLLLLLNRLSYAQSRTIHDGHTPPAVAEGAVAGSYPLSGFENINLYNGMLSVAFPLLKVGGRGEASYTMMLKNDNHWELDRWGVGVGGGGSVQQDASFQSGRSWRVGYGPGVLIGLHAADKTSAPTNGLPCFPPKDGFYHIQTLTRLTFVLPDGSEVLLHDKSSQQGIAHQQNLCSSPTPTTGFNRGKVFVSADGESMTFISDDGNPNTNDDIVDNLNAYPEAEFLPTGYLLMKNGTRYKITNGRVDWIRDRNGNKVTFTYETLTPYSWRVQTITDSLNRVITITYTTSQTGYDEISFPGFGGTSRSVKVWYSRLKYDESQNILYPGEIVRKMKILFPEVYHGGNLQTPTMGEVEFNPTLVSKIELPNERTYQFLYNSYGEIARIILPTGGGFDYVHSAAAYNQALGSYQNLYGLMIYRRVTKRVAYNTLTPTTEPSTPPTGTREKIENYEVEAPLDGWIRVRTDVRNGNDILTAQNKHYFYGNPVFSGNESKTPVCYSWWAAGKEYLTESYNVTNGMASTAPLRKSDQIWFPSVVSGTEAACYGNPDPNPKIEEVVNTLSDTSPNLVAKQTFEYDQYNNQKDIRDYDYGSGAPGALIRHTHTDFKTDGYDTIAGGVGNPDSASTIHIRNLPREEIVYGENGTVRAKTSYVYDDYAASPNGIITDRSSITGLISRLGQPPGPNYGPNTDLMRGNVTKVTRWLLPLTGTGTNTPIESFSQYDIAGNVVATRDPKGNITSFGYSDSFSGSFTANTYAFLTSTTSPTPAATYGGGVPLISSSVYDFQSGKVISSVDANNRTTMFEYNDVLDRLTKVKRPIGGGETRYVYGDADGTEADNLPDLCIQTITTTLTPTCSDNTPCYQDYVCYDGLGRVRRSVHKEEVQQAPPLFRLGTEQPVVTPVLRYSVKDTVYDGLGRVAQVSNPYFVESVSDLNNQVLLAATPGTVKWTQSTYDALSRVTKVLTTADNEHVDTEYIGNKVTVTDQALKKRSSVTDALGRLRQVTEAPGVANYGFETYYSYDVLNNLTRVRQGKFAVANPTTPATAQPVQFRAFFYDSLSRLVYANNPEQEATIPGPAGTGTYWTMKYEYDNNGNLTTRTDARNVTTTYTYDALNRNTTVDYSNTSTINPDIKRFYDAATTTNSKGRLSSTVSQVPDPRVTTNPPVLESQTIIGAYDQVGRVLNQTQRFKNNSGDCGTNNPCYDYSTTQQYNRTGNVTQVTYPGQGRVMDYGYDVGGRPKFAYGNLGGQQYLSYASYFNYNAAGQMVRERFGTQTVLYHTSSYNERFQMTESRLGTQIDQWNRGKLTFEYGNGGMNNGNLTKQEHLVPTNYSDQTGVVSASVTPMSDVYEYDALNRLTKVTGSQSGTGSPIYTQGYTYDQFGNRKIDWANTSGNNINNKVYKVNSLTNRLIGFSYDAAGNVLRDVGTAQTDVRQYDAENRMTMARVGGATSYYVYDGDGRRVRRIVNGLETWQVYGIGGELLAEYPVNGAANMPQKEYGYRAGQLLVTAEGADVKWLVGDHLGTPRMTAGQAGTLAAVRRHDYLPFGEELTPDMGNNSPLRSAGYGYEQELPTGVRQKFTGKERDVETGLDFAEARYYASIQGRFTSVDPREIVFESSQVRFLAYLSDPQNWNKYAYVLNNPLALNDPDGREPNKAQAGTVQQVVAIIQRIEQENPTATRAEVLQRTREHFVGMDDTVAGNFRYVYTTNSGWIDAKHFFDAAAVATSVGEGVTNILGVGVELFQTVTRNASAFSYEDLGSNAAGADFGDDVFDPNGGGTLSQQVTGYFNNTLGATTPQAAPNFNQLPATATSPGQGSRTSQVAGSRTQSVQSGGQSAATQSRSAVGNVRSTTSQSAGQACPEARCRPRSAGGTSNTSN